jgi:hypothetical protein
MIVGIVRRARWSFLEDVIVVCFRKFSYSFRRPSGDVGFSTVLPNIRCTCHIASVDACIPQTHEMLPTFLHEDA